MGIRISVMSFSAARWLADRTKLTAPNATNRSTMTANATASRVEIFN